MLDGLMPGDRLPRPELHARYGGRQQAGIGPSSKVAAVLFFVASPAKRRPGIYDGWDDDGLLNYVGEGQVGDQRLAQGNKAVLNHVEDGRSLEGFLADGSSVLYLGEFRLVDHYFTDAPDRDGELRQVVVFRLRPMSSVPAVIPKTPFTREPAPRTETVPVEERNTERDFLALNRETQESRHRESDLIHRYRDHLLRLGHDVHRLRFLPPGETRALYCDLWDLTTRTLIEAKATVSREDVRMAVGQLLDYARYAKADHLTVLVPSRPRPDLLDLLTAVGVTAVYPIGDGWEQLPHGR